MRIPTEEFTDKDTEDHDGHSDHDDNDGLLKLVVFDISNGWLDMLTFELVTKTSRPHINRNQLQYMYQCINESILLIYRTHNVISRK